MCDFKSVFRYNLKRHMNNIHTINDSTDEYEPVSAQDFTQIPPPDISQEKEELKDILRDLNLVNLLENFENEGVDLDLLISMDKDDLKDCLKEVGVKRFGDRYRICERILVKQSLEFNGNNPDA